jgi:error-prone DNA polymerase
VRPIDVQKSRWNCTLEQDPSRTASRSPQHGVRMRLRYVKGLGVRDEQAFVRTSGPYRDLEDFVRRVRLPAASLERLAEAGAFESLAAGRRDALWAVKGLAAEVAEELPLPVRGRKRERPLFAALSSTEEVVWDYRSSHHSTRGHPMSTIRRELDRLELPTASELDRLPDGKRVKYVGMTICRQQPGNKRNGKKNPKE